MINGLTKDIKNNAYLIPAETIKRHPDWMCLLGEVAPSEEELENLVKALHQEGINAVLGFVIEYSHSASAIKSMQSSYDVIKDFLFFSSASSNTAVITTEDEKFLLFSDDEKTFFAICGPKHFVENALQISSEKGKDYFFAGWREGWCNWEDKGVQDDFKFYNRIWDLYQNCIPSTKR